MRLVALAIVAVMGCAPHPPAAPKPRRGGELMIEVGLRMARFHRAAAAGAWELAAYDAHELREVFEDDLLPGTWRAKPPMQYEARTFLEGPLLQLEAAARTHDRDWGKTFATVVTACNHCHSVGHNAFIVVDDDGNLRTAPN